MRNGHSRRLWAVSAACAAAVLAGRARATDIAWTGGGGDPDLSTPANWAGGVVPGSNDAAIFGDCLATAPFSGGPLTLAQILFASNAAAFTFGGGTNTLVLLPAATNAAAITSIGAAEQVFNGDLAPTRGVIRAAAGRLVFNGGMRLGNTDTLNASGRDVVFAGTGDILLNGPVTGGARLIKDAVAGDGAGLGRLIIGGSNSFLGSIDIRQGTVRLTSASAAGAAGGTNGSIYVSGNQVVAGLELAGGVTFAPERLSLSCLQPWIDHAQLINGSGTNTWTGVISGGLGGDHWTIESAAGTLNISGDILNETGTSAMRVLRFRGAGDVSMTGTIGRGAGDIMIQKRGGGTLTIGGVSGHGGPTLIEQGTLKLGPAGSITASSSIDLSPGTIFDVSAQPAFALAGTQRLSGWGQVVGSVAAGAGRIVPGNVSGSGCLSISGSLSLNSATLSFDLAGSTNAASNDLLAVGGSLTLGGFSVINVGTLGQTLASGSYRLISYGGTMAGSAAMNLILTTPPMTRQAFALVDSVPGQVNLDVTGNAAELTWAATGGVAQWNVGSTANWNNGGGADRFYNLDAVRFDDTPMTATQVAMIGDLQPAVMVVDAARNHTMVGPGRLTGPAMLVKRGPGTLTLANLGINDYLGGTRIEAGTLRIGDGVSLSAGSLAAGTVWMDASARLLACRPDTWQLGAGLAGGGTLEQNGPGVLVLAMESPDFDGDVKVTGGTLRLTRSYQAIGSTNKSLIVLPGATLDLQASTHGKPLAVSGAGVGGAGALVNTGTSEQQEAVQRLTLAGDTTFGGTTRWDIRPYPDTATLDMGGFRITKTGSAYVALYDVAVSNAGHIDVMQGTFSVEKGTDLGGSAANVMRVSNGAALQLWNSQRSQAWTLEMSSAKLVSSQSSAAEPNTWAGPVVLRGTSGISLNTPLSLTGPVTFDGNVAITASANMTLTSPQAVNGTGGFTWVASSFPYGTLAFQNDAAFTGTSRLINGTLRASANFASDLTAQGGAIFFTPGSNQTALISGRLSGTVTRTTVEGAAASSTVVFAGNNDILGDIQVNQGTLRITHGSARSATSRTYIGRTDGTAFVRLELAPGTNTMSVSEQVYLYADTPSPQTVHVSGTSRMTGQVQVTFWNTNRAEAAIESQAGLLAMRSLSFPTSGQWNSSGRATATIGGAGDVLLYNDVSPGSTVLIAASSMTIDKVGAGRLSIAGPTGNTSGTVRVSAGTLAFSGSGALSGGTLELSPAGTLDLSATTTNPAPWGTTLTGSGTVVGTLSLIGARILRPGSGIGTIHVSGDMSLSGGSIYVDAAGDILPAAGVNHDTIDITGTLTVGPGIIYFQPSATNLARGEYRIATAGNVVKSGGTVSAPAVLGKTLSVGTTATSLNLYVPGPATTLTWTGGTSAAGWSGAGVWNSGTGGDKFYAGDSVIFADRPFTSTATVLMDVNIAPVDVVINNDQTPYLVQGTGTFMFSGTTGLTKNGPGLASLNGTSYASAFQHSGPTIVNQGTLIADVQQLRNSPVTVNGGEYRAVQTQSLKSLTVNDGGTVTISGTSVLNLPAASGVASLTLATNNARLDLGTGGLIIDYSGTNSVYTAVRDHILRAWHDGAWDGAGITSSAIAASGGNFALGYRNNTAATTFMGVSVDSSCVLVRLTTAGDANLDGSTTFADFLVLQNNYNQSGDWSQGDWNYDGQVTFADFLLLQNNYNQSAPAEEFAALTAFAAQNAPVPEPSALAAMAIGSTLMRRRRRPK